jgi:hypothetical protein
MKAEGIDAIELRENLSRENRICVIYTGAFLKVISGELLTKQATRKIFSLYKKYVYI